MALHRLPKTRENVCLALLELQENNASMDGDRLQEDHKSLAWVQEEMQREQDRRTGRYLKLGQGLEHWQYSLGDPIFTRLNAVNSLLQDIGQRCSNTSQYSHLMHISK